MGMGVWEWVNGCMEMAVWVYGNGCMGVWEWLYGCMGVGEWVYGNGCMAVWEWVNGCMGMGVWEWVNGCMGMAVWVYGNGCMGVWEWLYGCMGVGEWVYGCMGMVVWVYGNGWNGCMGMRDGRMKIWIWGSMILYPFTLLTYCHTLMILFLVCPLPHNYLVKYCRSWDIRDADVVCKMLGLGYKSAQSAPREAYFGDGLGVIWFDDFLCDGDEETLLDCSHAGVKVHNCRHSEDASAVCSSD